MTTHKTDLRENWIRERKALLKKEKEFTRLRDELSNARQALPWVKLNKEYTFKSTTGISSLAELFDGRNQLIVYHLMFGPDWETPCKSCSFWVDHFDSMTPHLNQRDVTLIAVSRAPAEKLAVIARRMHWRFNWVSSFETDFNQDFHVSFTDAELDGEVDYNFSKTRFPVSEAPGISVFYKDELDDIYHTYSCYARGLDMLNGTYQFLDIAPMGRNESALSFPMEWVRLHDEY